MQDKNEIGMLSVKELNKVINKLQKGEPITPLGTFSQVDIVFVAGLFLWYMQNKDSWTKIPIIFNFTESGNTWNHSHYFQQIFELYNIQYSDIFTNFLNAGNTDANSFSRFFAPPIYITRKSIDYFFGEKSSSRINTLKEKYIKNFDLSDFVNEVYKSYKNNKHEFDKYTTEISQRLKSISPVFVFIFIITCKRLAKKENRTFKETTDYIEKIWQFTQSYTNCLYELARNIVEHSGQSENDGQGMITIRVYSEVKDNEDIEKIKVLETHVFDYGKNGIYETLKQSTERNKTDKKNDVYAEDFDILTNSKNKYTLSDFLEPSDNQKFLMQQFYREMAHYGLMNFKNLIQQYEGKIIASSIRKDNENKREQYIYPVNNITNEEINKYDIIIGTSYYFEMLFIPALFERKIKTAQELGNQQNAAALSNIRNFELVEYSAITKLQPVKHKKYLINLKVSDSLKELNISEIDSRKTESLVCDNIIDKLNSPYITNTENIYITIDFNGVMLNKSRLLRILAKLSREKLSDFIVYNIACEELIGLIEDNEQWFQKIEKDKWNYIDNRKIDTSYWLKDKSILFFTRYKKQKDYFYFADFLFGETPDVFKSINKIISNTFTNTTYITKNENDFISNDNFLIPQKLQELFFYGNTNYLLPFDTLLKSNAPNDEEEVANTENQETEDSTKELFLFNIETVLKNKLFDRECTYNGIENFVNNFDGYHISDTHFKIGNKVHSSDFYYAKRLFQNSFYTTRLAMYLAKKIYEKNTDGKKSITLVGYEMYSELILSLIEKFLRDDFNCNSNHLIAQSKDDGFDFLPKNIFEEYLKNYDKRETIIIVPIAATGNTTRKIETEIRNRIKKYEKDEKQENEKKAEDAGNGYIFFEPRYNIILAQDPGENFKDIKNIDKKQKPIIKLTAKWYEIKHCQLCYGEDSKPLFDTDNSSLTPSLIFGNPMGQKKSKEGQIESNVKFDNLHFENSINYQNVMRNDNYRIIDVDSDIFIKENKPEIEDWLKNTVKSHLENECKNKLKSTDKIVIVAPCHESNSQFINLINEKVFSSAATIIHHQNGVDFVENFNILNKNYLTGENTKIFYVDDSLITGKHFFELFDLIRDVTENSKPLTASILLNDQAVPFIHDRAVRWSNIYFAFATYNQPPTLNILENRPLEHERVRYKSLQESVLHDTLCKHFYFKTEKLRPEKENFEPKKIESKEKQIRHLKLLEATHKIYEYFTNKENIPDLTNAEERNNFVDFNLKFNNKSIKNDKLDQTALLKVLSQYPFILYKNLRTETFKWHKELLKNNINSAKDDSIFNINNDYDDFTAFKLLLRRASFLGNNQVLNINFLKKLLLWFKKIDKYFERKGQQKPINNSDISVLSSDAKKRKKKDNNIDLFSNREEKDKEEENLRDFPIFVLGNYVEMIQRNGWIAYHILENVEKLDFAASKQGRQFYRMLQIESASVIDEFMEMIYRDKDYNFPWCDIYKVRNTGKKELAVDNTKEIKNYFEKKDIDLNKTNKYSVVKETFLNNSNIWKNDVFVNFLWIKQFLYADSMDEDQYLPKEIDYQDKIIAIIEKMKEFFSDKKNIKAFFIVTDGQEIPYVQYQDNYILSEFKKYYLLHKNKEDSKKFPELITFLNGTDDMQGITYETTAEYLCNNGVWKNIYNDKNYNLDFMPSDTKWLYLVRISEFKENKNDRKKAFIAQGLLGFYSINDFSDNILSKQLLMLLRKNMSSFIKKHHKNDEFSKWVLEKEKADNQFMRLHGTNIYDSAITYYKKITEKENNNNVYIHYLYILETWFAGRVLLLSLLAKEEKEYDEYNYETFKIEDLINSICENYKYILSFHNPKLKIFSDTNINEVDELVELSYDSISESEKNIDVTYLKKQKEQIIFEVFFNIRKHVLPTYYDKLVDNHLKIKIELRITEKNNIRYFEISNNFFSNKQKEFDLNNKLKGNHQDGLSFINNVFEKSNIAGEVSIKLDNSKENYEENKFILYIPITRRSN